MIRWKGSYGFRDKDGRYGEGADVLVAANIVDAVAMFDNLLKLSASENGWKNVVLWDVGMMSDADEEVC